MLALAAFACRALACSSDGQGERAAVAGHAGTGASEDETLIVPEGLSALALAGGNGVLDLVALTLRQGSGGLEVYAALRNDGGVPACHATLSLELYDREQLSLAVGTGGLLSQHFYELDDGSGTVASCVAPGDITMAAITDFAPDIATDDVGYVVYRCPYFALGVTPIDGLSVSDLKRVTSSAGASYTGRVLNGLAFAVKDPSVVVFPVNHVGRPLGMVTGSARLEMPAGGSWAFETSALVTAASDQVAFAEASLAH